MKDADASFFSKLKRKKIFRKHLSNIFIISAIYFVSDQIYFNAFFFANANFDGEPLEPFFSQNKSIK